MPFTHAGGGVHDDEQDQRGEQEVDDRLYKVAQQQLAGADGDDPFAEIQLAGQYVDNGGENIGDQAVDDGGKGAADDNTDCHVDDVAAGEELFEFGTKAFHKWIPFLFRSIYKCSVGERALEFTEQCPHPLGALGSDIRSRQKAAVRLLLQNITAADALGKCFGRHAQAAAVITGKHRGAVAESFDAVNHISLAFPGLPASRRR